MSETSNHSAQQEATNPVFQIQRLYLKDISLEQPNAPDIFLTPGEPNVQIQIDIQFGQLQGDLFEVIVIGNVTTRVEEKVLFLIEGKVLKDSEVTMIFPERIFPSVPVHDVPKSIVSI